VYELQQAMLKEISPLKDIIVEFSASRDAILSSNKNLRNNLIKNNLAVSEAFGENRNIEIDDSSDDDSPPPSSSDDRKSERDPPPPKRLRSSSKNGVQDRVISNCETPAMNSLIKNEILYVVKENSNFKCEYVTENGICDYWTSQPKKIFEHIVLIHRQEKFRCTAVKFSYDHERNEECEFVSKSQSELWKHIRQAHKNLSVLRAQRMVRSEERRLFEGFEGYKPYIPRSNLGTSKNTNQADSSAEELTDQWV